MSQLAVWRARIGNWLSAALGRSYWDTALGLGRQFEPGVLADYYRDYSGKVNFAGAVDETGLPLVQEPGGPPFRHPLVLAQKALGHWSCWLASARSDAEHERAFLALASAFVASQEPAGGWRLPSMEKPEYTAPYSAMAQGQAVSVLTRAFHHSGDDAYRQAARRGAHFMLVPVDDAGTARHTSEGIVLEEYPMREPNSVLNGWVSALFGLYDFGLIERDAELAEALESTPGALVRTLPRYDAGYWSYYDTRGALSSPYYQSVHLTQLRALELAFPVHAAAFAALRARFEVQQASRLCRMRALVVKAAQKLRERQTTVLIQPRSG